MDVLQSAPSVHSHSSSIPSLECKPLSKSSSVTKIATRRLSQGRAALQQHRKLVGRTTSSLNESKPASKTSSIMRRCWEWTCRTSLVKWGVTNTLKAVRFGFTCHSSPKSSRDENERELSLLTGSEHLNKLLKTLAIPLSKTLQELLLSQCTEDNAKTFLLKAFIEEETTAFQSLVQIMLPSLSVNLVRYVRESIYEETGEYPQTVSLLDIISCLSDLVQNHLPHIFERVQKLQEKTDSSKREQKILKLFIPLTDELLAILLPEGPHDLPVTKLPLLPSYTWELLRNTVIPSALMAAYQILMQPFNSEDTSKLLALPNGDSLVALAETAGMQLGEFIPALLTAESPAMEAVEGAVQKIYENKSPNFQCWMAKWVSDQIQEIASSQKAEINSIFKFCGRYVEPFLLHIFRHLATPPISEEEAQGLFPDSIGMMAIKIFSVISNFMNRHEEAITKQWDTLTDTTKPEEDPKLLKIFRLLADDLMLISGLADSSTLPVPNFLKEFVGFNIQAAAPRFLIQQYKGIKEGIISDEQVRKNLRSFLFDEKKLQDPTIGVNVIKFLHDRGSLGADSMFDEFYQQLWQESGTDYIALILENICRVLTNDFVNSAFSKLGLASQNALKFEQNPFMKKVSDYLKALTETIVIRIVTQSLLKIPENIPTASEEHPKKFLTANMLMCLVESGCKGLKNVDEKLKEIDKLYSDNPALHAVEKRKVFTKLANDLHAISGPNPLTHLPFGGLPAPESLKELLWLAVKTVVLPSVFAAQFDDIASWDKQLQDSFDKLEDCYHTSHPQWACKVLAQYGTDFIRHYMATGSDSSAKQLLEAMQSYFATSSSSAGVVAKDLIEQETQKIKEMLGNNISTLGDYPEAPMVHIWPLLTRYLEGIIAKFLAGISSTVQEIEENNPDFMVDIAIHMLKDTADYFKIVNDIMQQHHEEHPYSINPMNVITGFREQLHDGVPMDPTASENEKDNIRLKGCFIPRAMNLLELADVSIKDFPIPTAFRQPLGELIAGTILPLVLLRADENALGHHVRDALMLNFVQTLYAALNGTELIKKEDVLEEQKTTLDPKQKRLNETCGSVVLELVKLIPDTMVQYVFMKEKVQNMSAEAVGEAIMPHLSRWTLLQLIDTVIYVSLPGLHPAKWEGKAGREALIPRKAFIKPNGKMALKPVRKFKFHFPRTPIEIQTERLKQMVFANKTRLQLRDGFTLIISNQLRIKLWEAAKSIWAQFQGQLDVLVARQFPGKGPEIKDFLDSIFRKIFFDLIGTVIQFLSIPFINGLEFLAQKVYIDTKSKEIIENLHSDALENLVYKWMDTLLDTLLKLKSRP